MKVWTWVVALLVCLVSVSLRAETELDRHLIRCEQVGELSASAENMDVEQLEQAIDMARDLARATCAQAESTLQRAEERVTRLELAIGGADRALAAAVSKVDNLTGSELSGLSDAIIGLRRIPNQPSDENNQLIKRIQDDVSSSKQRAQLLATQWESLFAPAPDSPVGLIAKAAEEPEFDVEIRRSLKAYLARIPPYLLGTGAAPRQKLEFLQNQLGLVKQAMILKVEDYVRPVQQRARSTVREALRPDATAGTAAAIRASLLDHFSWHDVACTPSEGLRDPSCSTWAREASASGACSLAREKVIMQLGALESTVARSPDPLKEAVASALERDIKERKEYLSQVHCNPAVDRKILVRGLLNWQRLLPGFCRNVSKDVSDDVGGLVHDISAFQLEHTRSSIPAELDILHMIGEQLWSRGYYLWKNCVRSAP